MPRRFLQLAIVLGLGVTTWAQSDQTAPTAEAGWVEKSPGQAVYFQRRVAFAGGDMRFEGEPMTGAPYSAEAITESVQTLADGNTIRRENRTLIQRDSEGRTRRVEKLEAIGPWSTGKPHEMIFINDPVARVQYILDPAGETGRKIAAPEMADFPIARSGVSPAVPAADVLIGQAPPVPPPPADAVAATFERRIIVEKGGHGEAAEGVVTVQSAPGPAENPPHQEDLGRRMIEGLECVGAKFTTVLEAEQVGADRDIEIVFERWTSPELGVDVLTERKDPRFGVTTYRLTNISRVEPLPSAFEPPADYEIATDEVIHFRRQSGR